MSTWSWGRKDTSLVKITPSALATRSWWPSVQVTGEASARACEKLLDGLSRPVLLFQGVRPQARRLGRSAPQQRAGGEETADRAQPGLRRQGPETSHLLGDDGHVARESDRQLHVRPGLQSRS